MKKYGKFNEKGNEYIITDYLTPRPQMNYVWNERMLSGINHFGGGVGAYGNRASSYIDEKGRGRANLIKDGNRYFYIRDMKTGAYWNPGWYPSKTDVEEYSCTHGIGYTKISAKKDGIKAAITGFVGTKLPAEQWKIELENTDKSEREIKVYSYVEFSLEGYATYSEYDSYVSAWNCGNMIYAQNTAQERPHDWYNGFIASNEDITGFETSKNAFLGLYGSIFAPKTVADGKCTNSLAACERMVGVLENTFTIKPNEKKTFYVAIGSADSENTAKEMSEELLKDGVFEAELLSVQQMKAELQNHVMIKTPVEKINALTNYWVKNQVQLCAEAGRATGKGFRDQLQDAWGIAAFDSGMARVKILEVLAHQYSDGRCVRGWLPLDPHIYSDGPVWIAPAVNAYLKETGDFKFLDEPVKYLDDVDATVWEHLVCAAEYSANDLGVHGLVLAHDGDWNDSLNGIGTGGKGESVWTSIALCIALKETAEIAKEIKKDAELSDKLLKYRETMIKNINENAWDGEWYLAAYNDKGEKVGSHECKEGKIYLNSQTWAIIAGVCSEERKQKCIESVNKYLKCDYGFMTLYPAYTEYDKNVGRLTGFVPGIWENGTPYCHGGAFKLVADTVADRAEDAVNSYLLIAPDSEKNPSAYSGCEPYVFTNMYFGPDNIRKGQTSFAWVTGTAGWMFRVITQNILGFTPEYDGFKVNPCIPKDWDYAEETRKFRGDTYVVRIHNNTGENKLTLDGTLVTTDTIPHVGDGMKHIVEVYIK